MKHLFSILITFSLLLFPSCDYAIDRIEVPEKTDKSADWRIQQMDEFPYNHNNGGGPATSTRFFYTDDGDLSEVHLEGHWKKYYYYQDQLLINRVRLSWDAQDTLEVDSFFYFAQPVLMKEKVNYIHFPGTSYAPRKTISNYSYDSQGNIIQEDQYRVSTQSRYLTEIEWVDYNPIGISNFWIHPNDSNRIISYADKFTYGYGIHYELYKRWDPDALLPQNNVLSEERGSMARGCSYALQFRTEYDRQGRPIQVYRILSEFFNHVDTIRLIYE